MSTLSDARREVERIRYHGQLRAGKHKGGSCGSSSRIEDLHPELQPYARALVNLARSYGLSPVVTSTLRTYAQQVCLYEKAQRGESKYPASAPGRSIHQLGLGFDMTVGETADPILKDLQLRFLGAVWKAWGGQWGGDAPIGYDPIHFQMKQIKI